MFQHTQVFTSISVPDIAKAKEFYENTLGLTVTEISEGLSVALTGGGTLFIYPSMDYHAPEHTVLNFIVTNIEEAVASLNGKNVMMEQYPDFGTDMKGISRNDGKHAGPKAIAWFKDPADHIIAVIQEH